MNGYELIGETKLDVLEGQGRICDAALLELYRLFRYVNRLVRAGRA